MQVPALRKSLSAEVCAGIGELRAQVAENSACRSGLAREWS